MTKVGKCRREELYT